MKGKKGTNKSPMTHKTSSDEANFISQAGSMNELIQNSPVNIPTKNMIQEDIEDLEDY